MRSLAVVTVECAAVVLLSCHRAHHRDNEQPRKKKKHGVAIGVTEQLIRHSSAAINRSQPLNLTI